MRALKNVTFIYETREDRVLAAINAGQPEAWSCWLTRRLSLALLERAAEFVASTSTMAQQAPSELRKEFVAFERDAAIASTAGAMKNTPAEVLKSNMNAAKLADRLTISHQGDRLRLELHGQGEDGAVGIMTRAELQRILQMLQAVVAQAGWVALPAAAPAAAKPLRH